MTIRPVVRTTLALGLLIPSLSLLTGISQCQSSDQDGDGWSSSQGDCDDSDSSVYPGAAETCGDGVDQDCSGGDLSCDDVDQDGDGWSPNMGDCDDQDPNTSPWAYEVCEDGIDQDCNGQDLDCDDVDEDWDGYSPNQGDCDDQDGSIHPDAYEYCEDGIDQDCDGQDIDCDDGDQDWDGYSPNEGDCNDQNWEVHPDAHEYCEDGIDQDCDGQDIDCEDADQDWDGYSPNEGDCNDWDSWVNPDAYEYCNLVDDDCDGTIDDGVPTETFYADADGDGYGAIASTTEACMQPEGYVSNSGDCDDSSASVSPDIEEGCGDAIDNNCDGVVAPACPAQASGSFPTFGNGPGHTGYVPGTVGTKRPWLAWTVVTAGPQQVAVGGGKAFVTPTTYFDAGPAIKAFDAATGGESWRYVFNEAYSVNPPTFDSGYVYVQRGNHGDDSQLWSFYSDTGVTRWIAPFQAQWERYMAPTVANGSVFVNGGYYGGMYGFKQLDGQQLFFADLPQIDGWTPTWADGHLYTWVGGVFIEHDPRTGRELWSLDLSIDDNFYNGAVAAVAGGSAYLTDGQWLYAVDLERRRVAWKVRGSFTGTPAVADGVVYAQKGGAIDAFDALTGSYVGVYPGDLDLTFPMLVTDDALIVSSAYKTWIYDLTSFKPLQTLDVGGYVSFTGTTLYIASSVENQVRCYVLAE